MEQKSISPLLRYLRTVHFAAEVRERTDEDLLQRFTLSRDETAFAVLVQRHGPLVLGVCRRLLGHEQEAEDAFQATFLVFASSAASLRRREAVASFLHGIAERIARKARRTLARRRDRPSPLPEIPREAPVSYVIWQEIRSVLDEEIRRLPRCYREVFVLCYLEGQTNAEAARRLGCPRGTVLSRLARARSRLARQLRRRNITLPAAALMMILPAASLRAAVSPLLVQTTVQLAIRAAAKTVVSAGVISAPVLALATEGVQSMLWKKMTAIVALVLLGGALTATVLAQCSPAPFLALAPPESASAAGVEEKSEPEPAPKQEKIDPHLRDLLRKWTEADRNTRELRLKFTRTEKDPTLDEQTTTRGEVSLRKPDLWRMDVRDPGGKLKTVLLLEANRLHLFDGESKTEKLFPADEKKWAGFMSLLRGWREQIRWAISGPEARDVWPRFTVRLVKEDQWYSYLDLTPRSREDGKWFRRARVVLNREGYHVRQFWMEYANGKLDQIDYLDIRPNPRPPITRESLLKGLPKGWKRLEQPE